MSTPPLSTDGAPTSLIDTIPADVLAAYRELQLSSKVAAGASTQLLAAASKHVQDLKQAQATITTAGADIATATRDGQLEAGAAQLLSPAKFIGSVSDGAMKALGTVGTSFPTLFRGAAVVSTLYTAGKGAVALVNDAGPSELREKALELLSNIPGPVGALAELLGPGEKIATAADEAAENQAISLSTVTDATVGLLEASEHGVVSQIVEIAHAGVESAHQFNESGKQRHDIGEQGQAAEQLAQGLADKVGQDADSLARAHDLASLGQPENKAIRDQAQAALEEQYPGIANQVPPLTNEEIATHRNQLAHAAALSGQLTPDTLEAYQSADPTSDFSDDYGEGAGSAEPVPSNGLNNLDDSNALVEPADDPDTPDNLDNQDALDSLDGSEDVDGPAGLLGQIDPDDPDDAAAVDESDNRNTADGPDDTDTVGDPDDPDDADDPDKPADLNGPDTPDESDIADEPDKLSDKDNLTDPDNEDVQDVPDIPDAPSDSDNPGTLNEADNPNDRSGTDDVTEADDPPADDPPADDPPADDPPADDPPADDPPADDPPADDPPADDSDGGEDN